MVSNIIRSDLCIILQVWVTPKGVVSNKVHFCSQQGQAVRRQLNSLVICKIILTRESFLQRQYSLNKSAHILTVMDMFLSCNRSGSGTTKIGNNDTETTFLVLEKTFLELHITMHHGNIMPILKLWTVYASFSRYTSITGLLRFKTTFTTLYSVLS